MERRFCVVLAVSLLFGANLACGFPDVLDRSGCRTRLDQETLDRLTITMDWVVEMQPGDTRTFGIGTTECCYYLEPVDTCVTWSVFPEEYGSLNADTAELVVYDNASSGTVLTVTADIESGRRLIEEAVHVYTREDNPLVGIWREEAQILCDGGGKIVPEELIGELRFWANGRFSVTWQPFEIYRDYWGDYVYDMELGTLSLIVDGGNYVPGRVDTDGAVSFGESGKVVLRDIWLGIPSWSDVSGAECGHVFSR